MYYPVLDYPYTWCTQYPVLDLCDPHIWYIHYPVLDTASGIPSILYWIYVIPISGIFSIFGNLLPSAGFMESPCLENILSCFGRASFPFMVNIVSSVGVR